MAFKNHHSLDDINGHITQDTADPICTSKRLISKNVLRHGIWTKAH